MLRQISQMNPRGNLFIIVVLFVIGFVYYTGQYLSWWVKKPICDFVLPISIGYHIIFFLFLWSFFASIFIDPGRVPLYWGFFLDDPEHRKRRYCLICHIFKPERCHHCSACNRCVLNMDHHCPWINNCVGFYNRKFFILMVFYAEVSLLIGLIGYVRAFLYIISDFFHLDVSQIQWFVSFAILAGMAINVTLFFTLFFFLKFHITMVLTNMTTIENLDAKRGAQAMFQTANYDMGRWYNWLQIFGKNYCLWPFPMFLQSGKPVGDGVVWPQRYIDREASNDFRL